MNPSERRPPLRDYAEAQSALFSAVAVARKAAGREAGAIRARLAAITQVNVELTRLERLVERRGTIPP